MEYFVAIKNDDDKEKCLWYKGEKRITNWYI